MRWTKEGREAVVKEFSHSSDDDLRQTLKAVQDKLEQLHIDMDKARLASKILQYEVGRRRREKAKRPHA